MTISAYSTADPVTKEVETAFSTSDVANGFQDILAPVTLRLDLPDDASAEVASPTARSGC